MLTLTMAYLGLIILNLNGAFSTWNELRKVHKSLENENYPYLVAKTPKLPPSKGSASLKKADLEELGFYFTYISRAFEM